MELRVQHRDAQGPDEQRVVEIGLNVDTWTEQEAADVAMAARTWTKGEAGLITAIVAPPSELPSITLILATGATNVSFKKPNCLSHITFIPQKIDVNKMVCATTPGTTNWI